MTMLYLLKLLTCSCAVLLATVLLRRARRRLGSFPPGPPGWPIIGNALDFDPLCAWFTFTEWGKTYGELVGLEVLGTKILVLNSQKVISDLLDRRGDIYSNRPIFTAVGDLMGLNKNISLMPYGSEWRASRKLMHSVLGPAAVGKYEPVQKKFAAMLSNEIIEDADNFYDLIRLCAARVVLSVTYGLQASVANREYIDHVDETMTIISKSTVPGVFLCDLIPSMKYLPKWFSFHRKCAYGRQMIETMITTPYERVQTEIACGNAGPSLARELLINLSEDELTPEMDSCIKWMTGSMYGAGGETTFGTTLVFVLLMALHSDIQAHAHAELDSVIGHDQLPSISDRGSLPYIDALIKEVMRWHPLLPLSIARCTTQDDVYNGWVIPKGTIVMPNSWQTAFEPNAKYPPHEFNPERFLDKECSTTNPAMWAFGYGRRICPGKLLGEANVFIIIATLLATFDILPPDEGDLVPEFEHQLVSVPKRFKCKLIVHSERKRDLIREAVDRE